MTKSILSIDGGGMKGIISAIVLKKLEEYIQHESHNAHARLGEYFDLIAGTSTGSILTALYLCPDDNHKPKYSAEQILDFYLSLGGKVFDRQYLYPLFGSKYKNKGFIEILKEYFGTVQLSQMIKPCLITSYDTTYTTACFFNSLCAKQNPTRDYPIWELVLASCSAPTFFPPVCLEKPTCPNCFIDGGVVANNPSLCALIETMKTIKCHTIHDIHILSIGNIDTFAKYPYYSVKKFGLLDWAIPLFQIFKNSNEQTNDYQLRKLYEAIEMPENYIRIHETSNEKIPSFDDFSKKAIQYFINVGEKLTTKYDAELLRTAKLVVKKQLTLID